MEEKRGTYAERTKPRFGELIRQYRTELGWSQEVLARAADISVDPIKDIEQGRAPEKSSLAVIRALDTNRPFTAVERQELASCFLFPEDARSYPGGRNTIGLFISRADRPVWRTLASEIETFALASDYLVAAHTHGNEFAREARLLDLVRRTMPVAGVFLSPAYGIAARLDDTPLPSTPLLQGLFDRGVPIVFLDHQRETGRPVPCVGVDHEALAERAVRHLIERGHRRIGGLFTARQSPAAIARHAGFRVVLEAAGIYRDEWVAWGESVRHDQSAPDLDLYGPRHARAIARDLLNAPGERPSGIVCASVLLATEALSIARECGYSVPDTLSLICLDDADELAEATPGVTCVSYSLREVARQAMETMAALITGNADQSAARDVRLTAMRVIPRGSVAPPPKEMSASHSA